MNSLENVFSPELYNKMFEKSKDNRKEIGELLIPFLYFSMFIAFFAALFSEELIKILTPSQYHSSVPIVGVLCMNFGCMFFGKIVPIQFLYTKNTRFITFFTFFGVMLNIILNIPFILKFGVVGAAYATFIASLINNIVGFYSAQKLYKILYDIPKIVSIFTISIIGFLIVNFFQNIDISYLNILILKLILFGLFLKLGFNYGYFSKKQYLLVKSIFFK
jgi:O-antigen/teichoic acid export membrane protein